MTLSSSLILIFLIFSYSSKMSADFIEPAKDEPPANRENIPANNSEDEPPSHLNSMKKSKRKHYLSQQKQRKNNKNWKLNKFQRQQSEKMMGLEVIKNNNKNFDKNSHQQRRFNNVPIKFNKNILGRPRIFPILSKFFLPEKRPRKDLIVPPTKFLLGGNISDPLNLNSLQVCEFKFYYLLCVIIWYEKINKYNVYCFILLE